MKPGEKWKIIFLDVDGVINIPPYDIFDSHCLENLTRIIKATGAKIVVSSSWREGIAEKTKKHFPEYIFEHIIGETVRGYHYVVKGSNLPIVRGNEIKQWIDTVVKYPWHSNKELDPLYKDPKGSGNFSNKLNKDYSYVILDDDTDMLYEQKDNFVHTDGLLGLTIEDSLRAIEILNKLK